MHFSVHNLILNTSNHKYELCIIDYKINKYDNQAFKNVSFTVSFKTPNLYNIYDFLYNELRAYE